MANKYSKQIEDTIEKNKQKYIDHLLKLVSIDTHDIGHGIEFVTVDQYLDAIKIYANLIIEWANEE